MRQNEAIALLRGVPLLQGLDDTALASLVIAPATQARFARGETVFGPGRAPALGFVLKGSALVYKRGAEGRGLLMSRLVPGNVFGMASLFSQGPFPTEVVAEKPCDVLLWPRAALEAAFAAAPGLSAQYIGLLSERIHFLNRRIEALSGEDLSTRLLRLLQSMQAAEGEPFTLPYALSQLAALLGVGRATLYRALDALEADGSLRREGRQISLVSSQNKEAIQP